MIIGGFPIEIETQISKLIILYIKMIVVFRKLLEFRMGIWVK